MHGRRYGTRPLHEYAPDTNIPPQSPTRRLYIGSPMPGECRDDATYSQHHRHREQYDLLHQLAFIHRELPHNPRPSLPFLYQRNVPARGPNSFGHVVYYASLHLSTHRVGWMRKPVKWGSVDLIRWVAALLLYLTLVILNVRQYNDVVSYTFCLRTRGALTV